MSDYTEEEVKEIVRRNAEGSQNLFTFIRDVVKTTDTSKTGNLTEEELGMPKLPVRTFKDLELFSRDILDDECWAEFFRLSSENITSTSLSRGGFLVKTGVTMKKELADITPVPKKENKGWFKGRDKN